jgi:hypothetical protein
LVPIPLLLRKKKTYIPIKSIKIQINCEVDKFPTVPLWSSLNISITNLPILYRIIYNPAT